MHELHLEITRKKCKKSQTNCSILVSDHPPHTVFPYRSLKSIKSLVGGILTKRGKTSVTNLRSSWDTIIHGAGSYPHVSQHSQRVPRKRRVNLIQTQILCEKHGALDFVCVCV